jgi:hypothetical protein
LNNSCVLLGRSSTTIAILRPKVEILQMLNWKVCENEAILKALAKHLHPRTEEQHDEVSQYT